MKNENENENELTRFRKLVRQQALCLMDLACTSETLFAEDLWVTKIRLDELKKTAELFLDLTISNGSIESYGYLTYFDKPFIQDLFVLAGAIHNSSEEVKVEKQAIIKHILDLHHKILSTLMLY